MNSEMANGIKCSESSGRSKILEQEESIDEGKGRRIESRQKSNDEVQFQSSDTSEVDHIKYPSLNGEGDSQPSEQLADNLDHFPDENDPTM